MRKILLGMIVFCIFFLIPCSVGHAEETESFAAWYGQQKDVDGAYYKLTKDEQIPKELENLDGNGKVTIDCGKNMLVVSNSFIIDNPNLNIIGSGFCVIMENSTDSDLLLKSGTISLKGDGAAILCTNGTVNVQATEAKRFYVSTEGEEAVGIYLNTSAECTLDGIEIAVKGNRSAKGVYSYWGSNVSIRRSILNISANDNAYGVETEGNVSIQNSKITAVVSAQDGYACSVFASEVNVEDSVLMPQILQETKGNYYIYDYESAEPVVYNYGSGEKLLLPDTLCVYMKNKVTKEEITADIPVTWNTDTWKNEEYTYSILKGNFDTKNLDGIYEVKNGLDPRITIFTVSESTLFPVSYQIMKKAEHSTIIKLVIPFPYGAEELYLSYSTDGKEFFDYVRNGSENLLCGGEVPTVDGMYGFGVTLPAKTDNIYLKLKAVGGVFDGNGKIWVVNRNSEETVTPGLAGDQGGDRGGQTLNPDSGEDDSLSEGDAREQFAQKNGTIVSKSKTAESDKKSAGKNSEVKEDEIVGQRGEEQGEKQNTPKAEPTANTQIQNDKDNDSNETRSTSKKQGMKMLYLVCAVLVVVTVFTLFYKKYRK